MIEMKKLWFWLEADCFNDFLGSFHVKCYNRWKFFPRRSGDDFHSLTVFLLLQADNSRLLCDQHYAMTSLFLILVNPILNRSVFLVICEWNLF